MNPMFQQLSLMAEKSILGDAREVSKDSGVRYSEVLRLFMAAGAPRIKSLLIKSKKEQENER